MSHRLLLALALLMGLSGPVSAQADAGPPEVAAVARDQAALRTAHAAEINDLSTFRTLGLERQVIDAYLAGDEGRQFLAELGSADPGASADVIYTRAAEQLAAGSTLPVLAPSSAPLVKIVPHGQGVSPYSPYFTTSLELEEAAANCPTLAECFGLPLKSEAELYDIYQITPNGTVKVFISVVAPTEELGGLVRHAGGARQHLLPNRRLWSSPVLIGTIEN
ncbi:hypothetical protein [Janthinobacterium agaricidamnosum]|uniref:Uncharacterized protein n=1 Tax=Janthinobacterium agaricidamnosum NBRC 102515 = DSM 9628 TaxID=1349767 RepID=W0V8S7_9BURK|nr:hypothetical protein [Janthinobacterium agaricidamnosum]CDG83975.1 hypothetical protein GJA_3356 [Janthinobacterium agaricidamnosum NBRC 102515 = DSM 9628]